LRQYDAIDDFPPEILDGERRRLALLFKQLATLRTDAALFSDVAALRWLGATEEFDAWATKIGDARLLPRAQKLITDVVRN